MAISAAGANGASSQIRSIPGAPQKVNGGGQQQKKKKSTAKNGNGEAIDKAAHAAALTEKAPTSVDESVKVQASDVAVQAEHQAALEAIKIVESNGEQEDKQSSSALHITISKRIKVLSKKLQRATAYSELSEDKLNADMRRIIASKGNLEGAVTELTEVLKAIELNEKEQNKHQESERKAALHKAKESLVEENTVKFNTLFQLMFLYSLINASMQPQFAPPPLPTVLQNATSEHVAAISKLYADLSASAEVTSADVKSTLLDKLVSGSSDVILGSVSFKDVFTMIEGLSTPVVQQPPVQSASQTSTEKEPEIESDKPSILFMQASELDQASAGAAVSKLIDDEAPSEVKQSEPQGGAVDGVPAVAIDGGVSSKGADGPSSEATPTQSSKKENVQDGSAKAAVPEPVQTTEVTKIASGTTTPSMYKVIDWSAHDDDDFGDLEMQPVMSSKVAEVSSTPSQEPAVNGNGQNKQQRSGEDSTTSNNKGRHSRQGSNQQSKQQRQRGRDQQQQQQQQPIAKLLPQIDEDGFTMASSKRTKMLMQQQAAANAANRGGGGRTGNGVKSNQRNQHQNNGGKNGSPSNSMKGKNIRKGGNGVSGDQAKPVA